jgi:hypothetical protein
MAALDDYCSEFGEDCPASKNKQEVAEWCTGCEHDCQYPYECTCCGTVSTCLHCHEHNLRLDGLVTIYCDKCACECDPEHGKSWHKTPSASDDDDSDSSYESEGSDSSESSESRDDSPERKKLNK